MSKDLPRAAQLAQLACDGGAAQGCVTRAFFELKGETVPRNIAHAFVLLERACDLGDASACENIALRLAAGKGVTKDATRASSIWQRTCDLGDARECSNAAYELENGNRIPRDQGQALSRYDQACHMKNLSGTLLALAACKSAARMLRARSPIDWPRVVSLYELACRRGFDTFDACVELGNMYRDGLGVSPSRENALTFYRIGCDAGLIPACVATRKLTGGSRPGEISEDVADTKYIVTMPFALTDSLTLRLRFFGDDYGHLSRIDVMNLRDAAPLQTLTGAPADRRCPIARGPALASMFAHMVNELPYFVSDRHAPVALVVTIPRSNGRDQLREGVGGASRPNHDRTVLMRSAPAASRGRRRR